MKFKAKYSAYLLIGMVTSAYGAENTYENPLDIFDDLMAFGQVLQDVEQQVQVEEAIVADQLRVAEQERLHRELWNAFDTEDLPRLQQAIAAGAKFSERDRPLSLAVTGYAMRDIIEYLISVIPLEILNGQNVDGNTASHHLFTVNPSYAQRMLPYFIAAGADFDIRNNAGETARDLARKKGLDHLLPSSRGAYTKPAVRTKRTE